jgi:hypothetical protein
MVEIGIEVGACFVNKRKAVKIGGWAVLAAQAASWVTSSELQEIL